VTTTKKKWDLMALATIPLIMTLANSMLIPVLPLMQKELGITGVQTSLIITVYAAISIPFIPLAGFLSDRYGRKKIILIGLTLAALGGLMSGLAAWLMKDHAYAVIIAGRLLQGIGAAGAFPIVLPFIGDMFKSEEEVSAGLGFVETSNILGKVLSPVLGSALALLIWYLPLLSIPVISALSIIAIAFMVKSPKQQQQEKVSLSSFFKSIKETFAEHGRWLYAIFTIGGMIMFVMFGFLYQLSSLLEDKYNIMGIIKGLFLAIPLSAICLASFIAGKIIGQSKKRMKWFIVCGITALAVVTFLCALLNIKALISLIILLFIGGVGIGLALPSLDALITEGIEKKQRGTVTSLYSSTRFIGVAGGPLIASLLSDKMTMLFYIFTALGAVSIVVGLFAIKTNQTEADR